MQKRNPYKKRLEALKDVWEIILNSDFKNLNRESVVEILKKVYEKYNLLPIKGRAFPQDLYDKEMASLYVIGRYGLGLYEEYPELFKKIFDKELVLEEAGKILLSSDPQKREEARKKLSEILGGLDANIIARLLRVFLTLSLYGFEDEEKFIRLLKTVPRILPEHTLTAKNYARFYIAYKIAEGISSGSIKNKLSKEAYKHALGVKLGITKATPGDEYIYIIAKDVFNLKRSVLGKVLSIKEKDRKKK